MADLDELFSQLLDDLESTVLEVVQRFSSSSIDHESMRGLLLRMEEVLALLCGNGGSHSEYRCFSCE